ncbi:MAG: hypothetical protein RL187_771, partial [Actinomycetota bacterium]
MKAAIYRGPEDLVVEEVESPTISASELKIRVHSCATCGTDAKIFFHGHPRLTPPQIENSDDELVIATTRPETMLGDTAVAVHPEDERYKKFHGKFCVHPITKRRM